MNTSTIYRPVVAALEAEFVSVRANAEKAMRQLSAAQLRIALDSQTNSVAVIAKHMSGNFRSRFTDFLTTDGEKPTRHRDDEFIDDFPAGDDGAQAVWHTWNQGWDCVLGAIAQLADDDLARTVTIRGEPHTVARALARSLAHAAYHTGQIMWCARTVVGNDKWRVVTIARNASSAFNASKGYRPAT
jgi:uncharacterized damage-inducible protein DinB